MKKPIQDTFEIRLKRYLRRNQSPEKGSRHCPDENTVAAYLEGVLPQKSKEDFEWHAAGCFRCQEELALNLKSIDAAGVVTFSPALQSGGLKENWLSSILGGFKWMRNLGLKPALAIFIATVMSSYLGYELLKEHRSQKVPSSEIAEPISIASVPALEEKDSRFRPEPEKGQPQQKNISKQAADEKGMKAHRTLTAAAEAPAPGGRAATPPVGFSAGSKQENQASLRESRRVDSPKLADGDTSTAQFALEANQDGDRNSKAPAVAPSAAPPVEPTAQNTEAVPVQKQAPPSPSLSVVAGRPISGIRAGTEGAPASDPQETRTETQKGSEDMALLERAGSGGGFKRGSATQRRSTKEEGYSTRIQAVAEAIDVREPGQIKVAGKVFELRNNVWTDLSITEKEKQNPIIIRRESASYREQIKPLSPYQVVLSRPEDCLIKHKGKIYQVKSSP